MEAASSSNTLVSVYQSVQYHIADDWNVQQHYENNKCCISLLLCLSLFMNHNTEVQKLNDSHHHICLCHKLFSVITMSNIAGSKGGAFCFILYPIAIFNILQLYSDSIHKVWHTLLWWGVPCVFKDRNAFVFILIKVLWFCNCVTKCMTNKNCLSEDINFCVLNMLEICYHCCSYHFILCKIWNSFILY
jgi:hypothetical protein